MNMKGKIIGVLAVLAYWLGINRLFYRLNRRSKRIVTFHNIMPSKMLEEGDENLICFSDEKFIRILDEIGQKFHFSNDLADPSTCTLTFDDGYLNQLEVAGPILKEKGIVAILFLSRDLLDSKNPLCVDQCLTWAEKVPLEVAERGFACSVCDRGWLWRQIVRPLFAADGRNRGRLALKKLNDIWPISEAYKTYCDSYRRLRFTGVTSQLMEEYTRAGWCFGHHTVSHFPVKDLSIEEARDEMRPPVNMQNTVFSFPYGNGTSVSVRDVKLAAELGYPCAVSNEVEHTLLLGRYFMPRFMITSDDKYMIHFQLSGLKYFLKYRRLLPVCEF